MSNEKTEELYFTSEEISVIDSKLGSIVFDWAKNLVNNVIVTAKQRGVNNLYMNTAKTLDSGSNDDKAHYFYETLPERMNFTKKEANLRNKGMEELWIMELKESKPDKPAKVKKEEKISETFAPAPAPKSIKVPRKRKSSKDKPQEEKLFALEQVPSKLQGAVIAFIGRKITYTKDELLKVVSILEEKEKKYRDKKNVFAKFFYDWSSRTWSGGQRFDNNITEVVVEMKLTSSMYDFILGDPVLKKFMAFITSQQGHFDVSPGLNETIGFALISMKGKNWVINEVQTDSINKYLDIRAKYYKGRDNKKAAKMSWETIKDMLQAQNKSNWIAKLESDAQLKQRIIDNPDWIAQLPANCIDMDKWLAEQTEQRVPALA